LDAERFVQKQEQFKQIIQPPAHIDPDFQNPYVWRIGFARRLGAYIIDNVFLMLLLVVGAMITGVAERMMDLGGSDLTILANPEKINELTAFVNKSLMPLVLAITFIYYSLEVIFGQSLGKILLGMQIGCGDKKFASYQKLLLRFALKFSNNIFTLLALIASLAFLQTLSTVCGFVFFAGCFFALGIKKQALHDMLAGTAVYFKDELQQLNSKEQNFIA
jgi:uncharacterized RDD family membrane protein YckC